MGRDYGLKHVLSPVEGSATLGPLRHRLEPCGVVFLRKVRTPRKGSVASHREKTLRCSLRSRDGADGKDLLFTGPPRERSHCAAGGFQGTVRRFWSGAPCVFAAW